MQRKPHKTYEEAVEYLMAYLPMYHRIGAAAYKKDLTNTLGLMAHLGQPHQKFKTIHVGGTNGKGSVSHLLAALYAETGLKVGLYTSPHYLDYRERIKINGQPIDKDFVTTWVNNHQNFIEWLEPSFFEMTVGLAFDYFAQEKVDLAIIEVGLGGRLDSTNVITPVGSVITNISYDHMNLLGDTLPQIAAEKAGIIKYRTPVIIGEIQEDAIKDVFKNRSHQEDAPIAYADDLVQIRQNGTHVDIAIGFEPFISDIALFSDAPYQIKNIKTALAFTHWINRDNQLPVLSESVIREVLGNLPQKTGFMGRWQILGRKPLTLGDSAHNEAGMIEAMSFLATYEYDFLHFVIGVVNDKDLKKLAAVLPKTKVKYYVSKAQIPRGLEAQILTNALHEAGFEAESFATVCLAYEAAKSAAKAKDLIFVGGSIFTLAEVL
jgi:dihydrofolate synthase / folylpolyglutamate synthase